MEVRNKVNILGMSDIISEKIDPHSLNSCTILVLWALNKMENDQKNRYTPTEISSFLIDKYGISITRQAVFAGLKANKKAVHKNNEGYKLMELGRQKLSELVLAEVGRVVTIESGKPFSTKTILLKEIFQSLGSNVSICDPYIDLNTLDLIFKNFDQNFSIRILTKNLVDKPEGSFCRHLNQLRQEGFKIEVGVYTKSELHDRYFFDDQNFWLSGNSLNYLGDKESFLVRLGSDVLQSMTATFNNRWKIANKI